jgi:uncharacterized protein YgiM (DUF1202 family)
MRPGLLFCLFFAMSFSALCQNDDCYYDDSPLYMATVKLNIYEYMSSESAVIGEVPKGATVVVTESFFGETGWWEICYKGITGQVKKSGLTKAKKVQSTPNQERQNIEPSKPKDEEGEEQQREDIGFNPFIGQTTSAVNFRKEPTTKSSVIKQFKSGATVYVFSDKTISGFYKVIDVETGKIGWASKTYIKKEKDAEVDYEGGFQKTGISSSLNSEVLIKNLSNLTISLIVGDEMFSLSPKTEKTVFIMPGSKYYVASAPGVIPASGYQKFEGSSGYGWSFWVERSK